MTPPDWEGLAAIAASVLPPFGKVHGVPRGGIPFALALSRYVNSHKSDTVLLAEDVVTSGGSIKRFRDELALSDTIPVIGVTVFARGEFVPDWVVPLFQIAPPYKG